MCIGYCMVKHWSSTQKASALSSAEAELYAATRALTEANPRVKALVDAQTTIGLSRRSGLGKARHAATAELWIQDLWSRRRPRTPGVCYTPPHYRLDNRTQ